MEFEKLRDIIVEVLNVDETEVTMESTFIDEIHRFSKSQQDSLLGAVEQPPSMVVSLSYWSTTYRWIST